MVKASLAHLFFKGDFHKVLAESVNHTPPKTPMGQIELIIGALVLTGKLDHALALYRELLEKMSLEQQIGARFYLGIGHNRRGQYHTSMQIFAENLKTLRHSCPLSNRAHFYIYQGIAFHYLYECRYDLAISCGQKALEGAFRDRFSFGRILACDLLGNAFARRFDFSRAHEIYQEGIDLAQSLGNEGILEAIRINQMITDSLAGRGGEWIYKELLLTYQKELPRNNFSKATLGLGLVKQLHLRGQMDVAEQVLTQIEDFVNLHKSNRQSAQLRLAQSYHAFLRGDVERAEAILERNKALINFQTDHSLALNYFGLKERIVERLGRSLTADERKAIKIHEHRSKDGFHQRVSRRKAAKEASKLSLGEDPLGDLLDQLAEQGAKSSMIREILNQGTFGLLRDAFRIAPGSQLILLDALPGIHIIFDRGQVYLCETPLFQTSRQLLCLLDHGPEPIFDIVRKLWGQTYRAERHNNSFYSVVSRLRQFLGPYRDWLENHGGQYQLKAGVKILEHRPFGSFEPKDSPPSVPKKTSKLVSPLNLRQIRLLEALDPGQVINNQWVQKHLKTSYATATRDLTNLVERGLLAKYGKGKSTAYRLHPEFSLDSLGPLLSNEKCVL